MARHEWVRLRLDNWAEWLDRSERGALGYPKATPFARWQPASTEGNSHIPVSEVQAKATDDALAALRFTHPRLYLVVHMRWAGDPRKERAGRGGPMTVEATGRALCVACSTVFALQAQALDQLAMVLPRY